MTVQYMTNSHSGSDDSYFGTTPFCFAVRSLKPPPLDPCAIDNILGLKQITCMPMLSLLL
jgi:hypothetical protein